MTTEIKKKQIRLPQDLYDKLIDSAKEERRSLNAEVLHRIDLYLKAEESKIPNSSKQPCKILTFPTKGGGGFSA